MSYSEMSRHFCPLDTVTFRVQFGSCFFPEFSGVAGPTCNTCLPVNCSDTHVRCVKLDPLHNPNIAAGVQSIFRGEITTTNTAHFNFKKNIFISIIPTSPPSPATTTTTIISITKLPIQNHIIQTMAYRICKFSKFDVECDAYGISSRSAIPCQFYKIHVIQTMECDHSKFCKSRSGCDAVVGFLILRLIRKAKFLVRFVLWISWICVGVICISDGCWRRLNSGGSQCVE